MTDDQLKEYWDRGWNDYWDGKKQNNCPTWPDQEKRDQWMMGWLTAQSTETYAPEYVWVQSGKYPEKISTGDLTNP